MAPEANRNGRNNAKTGPNGLLWAVFDRSDGEGKSVMTIDLSRTCERQVSVGEGPLCTFRPQRPGSLYIDAGKRRTAQEYNRFDGLFRRFRVSSNICNFTFDTPEHRPYKRGSHGERGVPKTSRRKCDAGFSDPKVPPSNRGSRSPGRALYASLDRKGIRRRRRTSVPCLRIRAQMFSSSLVRNVRRKSDKSN